MLATLLPVILIHATTFPPVVDMNCKNADIFLWAKEKNVILIAPVEQSNIEFSPKK